MIRRDKALLALQVLFLGLAFCLCDSAFAQPAAMISDFRVQHGEGRVTSDSTLNRIAQDQANAMASKGVMTHEVLGPFSSRVSPAGAQRAAENIAYGYDEFPRTLDQWINSAGHRKNLLMHGAARVGVASAKSSVNGRTYWAMVITGGYENPRSPAAKPAAVKPTVPREAKGGLRASLQTENPEYLPIEEPLTNRATRPLPVTRSRLRELFCPTTKPFLQDDEAILKHADLYQVGTGKRKA